MKLPLCFLLCSLWFQTVSAQATISILPNDIGAKFKNVDYEIKNIRISSNKVLGKIKLRDQSMALVQLGPDCEAQTLRFLQNHFRGKATAPEVSMLITELRIISDTSHKSAINDEFIFKCEFYKGDISHRDLIYTFTSKNRVGDFLNMQEVLNNYYSRALISALDKFTMSLDTHPEWLANELTSEKPVKTSIIYNMLNGRDSIACRKTYYLKLNDYPVSTKDTTPRKIFTKITFTYKLDAQENSKELNLKIYPMVFFEKNKSWIKSNQLNESELSYQQGHFDLGTIYGEKFANELKATSFSLGEYKSQMNTIYNKHFSEYAEQRKKYKEETNDGKNIQQVNLWRKKINAMLSEIR